MKEEVKTPVIVVVAVVVIAGIVYWGMHFVGSAGNLDQGQIKYTPGVPPWLEKDPSKRGPGGTTTPSPPGGGPAGLAPPTLGNKSR